MKRILKERLKENMKFIKMNVKEIEFIIKIKKKLQNLSNFAMCVNLYRELTQKNTLEWFVMKIANL